MHTYWMTALTLGTLLVFSAPASAHHGAAAYDLVTTRTLDGVVTNFKCQTADRVLQLFEYNHNVRRIYTDGRAHPSDLQETESAQWMGHSIGHWESDTFVIDTVGFNDRTWLDRVGHPHSAGLHLIERLRRIDHGTLEYTVTVDDPKAYVGPWTGQMMFTLRPDWEVLEHNCMPEGEEYLRYKERAWKHR